MDDLLLCGGHLIRLQILEASNKVLCRKICKPYLHQLITWLLWILITIFLGGDHLWALKMIIDHERV